MVIPTELFRFRIVRGTQAQKIRAEAALDLTDTILSAARGVQATRGEQSGIDDPEVRDSGRSGDEQLSPPIPWHIDPATWDHWLCQLSSTLALQGDAVDPVTVVTLLPTGWREEANSPDWDTIKTNLARSLNEAIVDLEGGHPSSDEVLLAEGLARLLRVQDLVSVLLVDEGLDASDRRLTTAREVQAALTYKIVILPKDSFLSSVPVQQLVRRPGVTDLYLVKDEWIRYEAGELARVINVLPGETFDSKLKHLQETEATSSETTQTTTTEETENSQTQTSTVSQSATKDASLNVGVNTQVEVSAQYGPAHVQASLGAQLQTAMSESETRAFTISNQTVQRAIKEVSRTVIDVQTRRTLISDLNTEQHKLANEGSDAVVGLYRWLSEVRRCWVERYPNRFVLEFEIPEPGAWLRWAADKHPLMSFNNPDPGPFTVNVVDDEMGTVRVKTISPPLLGITTIDQIASKWRFQGIDAPPPGKITVSTKLTVDPKTQNEDRFAIAYDSSIQVPSGYQAVSWTAEVCSVRTWSLKGSYGPSLTVCVGGGKKAQNSTPSVGKDDETVGGVNQSLEGSVGEINTGAIPVTAYSTALQGFTCVVNVVCGLMGETWRQWQQQAFDQIAAGYQSLLVAHQQELAAAGLKPGALADLVGPPALNRARAVAELRRLVVESLTDTRFNGVPAIDQNPATDDGEPNVDLAKARVAAPVVQFFEQAFEWENIVYIPYPYYWGRRSTWPQNALSATEDPEFDRFLNSGSARVVVPARPGFEHLVNFFLYTGVIWGGTQPPAPNDPGYLSIAQEIQAMQVGATDGTQVGEPWEISLPTTLLWAGDDPETLPTNPNPTIPAATSATTS